MQSLLVFNNYTRPYIMDLLVNKKKMLLLYNYIIIVQDFP